MSHCVPETSLLAQHRKLRSCTLCAVGFYTGWTKQNSAAPPKNDFLTINLSLLIAYRTRKRCFNPKIPQAAGTAHEMSVGILSVSLFLLAAGFSICFIQWCFDLPLICDFTLFPSFSTGSLTTHQNKTNEKCIAEWQFSLWRCMATTSSWEHNSLSGVVTVISHFISLHAPW